MEEFKEDEKHDFDEEFEIPYELSYNLIPRHKYDIDESQLQYQNLYKSFDYYAQKFPYDYSHLKGFDKLIQMMADTALTPLEELEIIKSQSNDIDEQDNRHDSIISE
jgi:hypothetical protein